MPNEFCTKETFPFAEEIKGVSINDKFLVSFDENSLFTNIPLKEKIKVAVDLIKVSYPNLKVSSDNLTKLFRFAICKTHFLFNGKFCDQIDNVAMGSPLAAALVNCFMGHNEKLWIENFQGTPPSYCSRYVNDIFSVCNNSFEAKEFSYCINTRFPNITFTTETEVNKIIPFLDVLIENSQNILKTSTYHKSAYSGLLLN